MHSFVKVINLPLVYESEKFETNGIRIIRYHKDKINKNFLFDLKDKEIHFAKTSIHRLTNNPKEIKEIKDISDKTIEDLGKDVLQKYAHMKNDIYKIFNNDFSLLCTSCTNIIRYGDIYSADIIFENKIVYFDGKAGDYNIFYIDDNTNKLHKMHIEKLIKKYYHDDYHTVIFLPNPLYVENISSYCIKNVYDGLSRFYDIKYIQKIKNIYRDYLGMHTLNTFAKVIKDSTSEFFNLKKDELVLIYKKGKFKKTLSVITSSGQSQQANTSQLEYIEVENIEELKKEYYEKRKEYLRKEQEEGVPLLLTIYYDEVLNPTMISDSNILYATTLEGNWINIPKSIIPNFDIEKIRIPNQTEGAHWVNVPMWYYKKIFK